MNSKNFSLIIICLLICVILIVPMLAACQPSIEETEEPAVVDGDDQKPFEGVTLNLLQETVPDLEYFKKFIPEFEEKTGMTVNIEEVTYVVMHEKLVPQLTLPEGQGAYDVIIVDKQWVGEFVAGNWIRPLDDYIARDNFDTSVYFPAMLETVGVVNDVTYMLPFYNYSTGLVYRTDIFNDPELQEEYRELYGKPLEVPTSLDEYVETAKFLTRDTTGDGNIDLYGVAMQLARFPAYGEYSMALFGQDGWYYDDNWNAAVNGEKGIKAMEALIDLYENATTEAATGYFFDEQLQFFREGNAAMMATYSWTPNLLQDPESSSVAGNIGVALYPGGHGMQGGWGWAIPNSAENPEASWEFIKWVESFEIAKARALEGGAPTRDDVFTDPDVIAKWPFTPDIKLWVETGKPFPIISRSLEIIDVLALNVSEALIGNKGVQEAMDDSAAILNELVIDDPIINQ